MSMKIPLIAVVSGKFAAIRAFSPAQTAVRKQEFGQSDLTVASGLFVEPLGGPARDNPVYHVGDEIRPGAAKS
ncbi:MAG: hypothetical protein ABR905_08160 [Terracidiphilus sp.]|jgi:acetyl-CoA carboxylase carboxyltransferase component